MLQLIEGLIVAYVLGTVLFAVFQGAVDGAKNMRDRSHGWHEAEALTKEIFHWPLLFAVFICAMAYRLGRRLK